MAGRWRIRHKLMLGLGLVVAILGLLLAGTIKGLVSYRATIKTIQSKLAELDRAEGFRQKVAELRHLVEPALPFPSKPAPEIREEPPPLSVEEARKREDEFDAKIEEARTKLKDYKVSLQDTLMHKRDPDNGYGEIAQVKALEEEFARLAVAIEAARKPQEGSFTTGSPVLNDPRVQYEVEELVRTSGDLLSQINGTLYTKLSSAHKDYTLCLAVVLSTSVLGILLMAGLLRFFYGWVFYPIRDLEQGANRIAQGDFEHRIEVHSGDEMEDLARAFNDMTGRLQEMYTDLARQVNERSRQLVRSERLAGVGFLAAGVAHEINNPLASIAFCSEAMERRLADVLGNPALAKVLAAGDRETLTKYLRMIQEEAFRCKEITQRLLEFSRGGERRREPTDLAALVQGVLEVVQHLQNCKGKHLIFQPAGPLVAWANGQEVKSVVLNLVVNALDSMDEGGTLRITLAVRDGMAELVFADTGCGMTPEILENIFEPFFTRSRTGKGTGLGLSISHRIINQHGGEIEAVSPGPNQGSTFTVRLPLKPPEGGEQQPAAAEPRPEPRRLAA